VACVLQTSTSAALLVRRVTVSPNVSTRQAVSTVHVRLATSSLLIGGHAKVSGAILGIIVRPQPSIASGQSDLTKGRIAAANGLFSRIRQVAPMCTPT